MVAVVPSEGLIALPRLNRAVPYVVGTALIAVPVVFWGRSDWQLVAGIAIAWAMMTASGAVLLRRARHLSKMERRGWSWVASGLLVGSVGLIVSVVAEATFATEQLRFGVADLFFLSASLCGMIGVIQLPHGGGIKALRIQTAFDGLIGGLGVAVLLWVFFVGDIVAATSGSTYQMTMGRLYPVIDLMVLITVITVTVRRTAVTLDGRLLMLSAGLTIQAIVDLVYLDATRPDALVATEPDRLVVGLTLLAVSAYAVTAILPDRVLEPQIRRTSAPKLVTAFPYAMVVALVTVLSLEAASLISLVDESRSLEYAVGVALVILLVLIRQAVSLRENRLSLETQRRELVASISHEVRTPVTAILASLELIESHGDQLPEEERGELAGIALDQTRYMARMVEDLILLSRNSRAGLKLRARNIELDDVIDAATADLQSGTVQRRGLTGVTLTADPDRLRQAISNYLSNAIQYGNGECIVDVQGTDRLLMIEVHDDGPGVPYRYREVIWEHFERGSHRLDSQVQGSGIGLAVVDAVAKAHGGYVEYRRSQLLGGSCFTLVLPRE